MGLGKVHFQRYFKVDHVIILSWELFVNFCFVLENILLYFSSVYKLCITFWNCQQKVVEVYMLTNIVFLC